MIQAICKNLERTHLERLNEKEANKYVIYKAILEKLPVSKNLDDLKVKLQKENIETLYKYKGQTNELQGISFRIGDYKYKGSEIDRQFSVKNLGRTIIQQQTLSQLDTTRKQSSVGEKKNKAHHESDRQLRGHSIFEQLIKPEHNQKQVPYQWKTAKNYKKKKSRGLHL